VTDDFQIEIAAIVVCKARIENGCRLAPSLANFICFERAFDDIGNRSMFAARQATRQVASLRAAHGGWDSAMLEVLPECHSGSVR
jgi:hypothetical protein